MSNRESEGGSEEEVELPLGSDGNNPSVEELEEATRLLKATDFKEYLSVKSSISENVEKRMSVESDAEFFSSLQDSQVVETSGVTKDDG